MIEAFRLKSSLVNGLLRRVLAGPINRTVAMGEVFEQQVRTHGHVQVAGQWMIAQYAASLDAGGASHVPTDGPLLLVCNHAGMGDALAVFASLPRTDVYTMLFKRGLLNALPAFQDYAIVIDEANPVGGLKHAIRRLRAGQAVLLFPRGEIEDDPALNLVGAQSSLPAWSPSIEFIARKVPGLRVQPVAVGNLLSPDALRHPLVRLYRQHSHQMYLAATLQLLFPRYRNVQARVQYGRPLTGDDISLAAVTDAMRGLLAAVGGTGNAQSGAGDQPKR